MLLLNRDKRLIRKVEYKLVRTRREFEGAYHLVYKTYLASKLTKTYRCPIRLSVFNALPTTTTFIAKLGKKVIGTATMIIDSPLGIPMDKIYKKELDRLRKNGRKIAEISMLGTSKDFFVQSAFSLLNAKKMIFLFKLFKLILDYALYKTDLTDFCIAVHPRHAKLYRFLNFEKLGGLRYYVSVNRKPALGFRLDLIRTKKWIKGPKDAITACLYTMFFGKKTPDSVLNEDFSFSESDLKYFFVEKSDVFKNLDSKRLNYLKECYPDYDFKKILEKR